MSENKDLADEYLQVGRAPGQPGQTWDDEERKDNKTKGEVNQSAMMYNPKIAFGIELNGAI